MERYKVYNMCSPTSGREVANQFEIHAGGKIIFQSYDSVIAIKENGEVTLDVNQWDYSSTTGKYRNQFLGEGIAETRKKIKAGIYKLDYLN